jgi:hypothetical protein
MADRWLVDESEGAHAIPMTWSWVYEDGEEGRQAAGGDHPAPPSPSSLPPSPLRFGKVMLQELGRNARSGLNLVPASQRSRSGSSGRIVLLPLVSLGSRSIGARGPARAPLRFGVGG